MTADIRTAAEPYTPTTDEVRGDYAHFQVPGGTDPVTGEFAEGLAEFDRWLAEVERAAAARALAEVRSTIGAYQENGVWAFDQAVACIERARVDTG